LHVWPSFFGGWLSFGFGPGFFGSSFSFGFGPGFFGSSFSFGFGPLFFGGSFSFGGRPGPFFASSLSFSSSRRCLMNSGSVGILELRVKMGIFTMPSDLTSQAASSLAAASSILFKSLCILLVDIVKAYECAKSDQNTLTIPPLNSSVEFPFKN
jgi:hypothetical protein